MNQSQREVEDQDCDRSPLPGILKVTKQPSLSNGADQRKYEYGMSELLYGAHIIRDAGLQSDSVQRLFVQDRNRKRYRHPQKKPAQS